MNAPDASRSGLVLHARGLTASGSHGVIFGPVDLDLSPRQLTVIHGPKGTGKSALLLALTGRFRKTRGTLIIDGVDAIADPYHAIRRTSVATIGNYVQPEDRLTLAESIAERGYLDSVPLTHAEDRMRRIEELVGYTIERSTELEQLTAMEHAIASVALAMIRPSKLIVIDDADVMVPHAEQKELFEIFLRMTELDDSAIVATTVDDDMAPPGSIDIALPARHRAKVHPISGEQVAASPATPDASAGGDPAHEPTTQATEVTDS
ncbi:ATP-binding cassette domain-containing protein [Acidipropionibacterium virtanenii]|uniref:ATP-binding cassette domain-containing protein n=1 Tax=Acidipropionibacterium virtanenii TaxID=2057246 RepID=UPI000DEC9C4F